MCANISVSFRLNYRMYLVCTGESQRLLVKYIMVKMYITTRKAIKTPNAIIEVRETHWPFMLNGSLE